MSGFVVAARTRSKSRASSAGRVLHSYTSLVFGEETLNYTSSACGDTAVMSVT